ncbi:Mur ligase family protein [Clostridium frigidicarnis]|uniref:Lipid II isoglutaminyl synthase (glutamine-hydrolyzing) subunit MurT n=1 Tax=Clostridium frigidicarnis TaxID=84698 RepID=A0A1I0XYK3_9CLOT|nr:Mur ligase family protein [Clostridium frigidicarnis]SFB05083.1 UDP-N-acetylmuramyl tripeptide synthase [Clostridium frigidicarnis]
MFKINIKSFISIISAKITLFLAKHLFKGGSNFPGRVALKIDKDVLKPLSNGYKVVLVTGTNGKTTTTSMIYNILKSQGLDVITNNTGANMLPGIVACFADNYKFFYEKERFAVIEVDEANVKFITKHITPNIITITNLFRDQLDRYGEVYTTLEKIMEGVVNVPESKLILNGDESLLGKLNVPNEIIYYGFNESLNTSKTADLNADAKFCKVCKAPYKYNFITYNHLGDFYCDNCGYRRETLKYMVNSILEVTPDSSKVLINNSEINLSQSGIYNVYNALCAYSITHELGVGTKSIVSSLENQSASFGRQEVINIDDKEIKIFLVKNPAGYNQALDTICFSKENLSLAFFLNDNYADGRDISWLWDVNFEHLNNLNVDDISIGGIRLYDMAIRLKISGLNYDEFKLCDNYDKMTDAIKSSKNKKVYVLATYTAMINYRKYLHTKGYIKNLW